MLIRKPVAHGFEAFVDPAITSKLWLTKSSGRLEHDIILNLVPDRYPPGIPT